MMFETRKILEDESIGVAVTCVRVPVRVCHSESVNVQTREPISAERGARAARPRAGADARRAADAAAGRRAATRCSSGGIRRDESHPAGAEHVGRQRQPPQGGGDERGPDRGAARGCAEGRRGCLRLLPGSTSSCAALPRRGASPIQPVPSEVIERVLDNARFAPSGGNRQGWRVIVVTDADTARASSGTSTRDRAGRVHGADRDARAARHRGAGRRSRAGGACGSMLRGADEYAHTFDRASRSIS